ncbi:hypothetical protein SAMN05518668_109202 [Sphingobium sp. YR657]|nr:hypothetical protein SAMN05518668_109202 [Sphingobium sp. YR657]
MRWLFPCSRRRAPPAAIVRDSDLELLIAERAAGQALAWRFRLIVTETFMMALLVAIAGVLLHKPPLMVARASLGVGVACFVSGMLLVGLSGAGTYSLFALKRWWRR